MKIEIHAEGPNVLALVAEFTAKLHAAREADGELWRAKFSAEGAGAPPPEPEAKAEPAARKSRKKAEPEPEPQIRATPEDRKPVEEIPEAEVSAEPVDDIFDETPSTSARVYTRDDVKAAMKAYADKHGMAELQSKGKTYLGYAKLSDMPEDQAAFKAACDAFAAATERADG